MLFGLRGQRLDSRGGHGVAALGLLALTEAALLLRAGDPDATRDALRALLPRVRGWLYRLLGGSADLDDATQDALAEIARFLPRFEGRSSLATAAHRITVRVAYRYRHVAGDLARGGARARRPGVHRIAGHGARSARATPPLPRAHACKASCRIRAVRDRGAHADRGVARSRARPRSRCAHGSSTRAARWRGCSNTIRISHAGSTPRRPDEHDPDLRSPRALVDELGRIAGRAEPPPIADGEAHWIVERALDVGSPARSRRRPIAWAFAFGLIATVAVVLVWLAPRASHVPSDADVLHVALPTGDRLTGVVGARFDVEQLAPTDRRLRLYGGLVLFDVAHVAAASASSRDAAAGRDREGPRWFSVETDAIELRGSGLYEGIVEVEQGGDEHLLAAGAVWDSTTAPPPRSAVRPRSLATTIASTSTTMPTSCRRRHRRRR